jgi:flagellin-like protein
MSNPIPSTPVSVVTDDRPAEVVIVSHSPLFYWWPVWLVGFLMAGLSYWQGEQVAFVPPGTVAERGVRVEGQDGPRDVLIAPAGQQLPSVTETDELKQPRLRMAASNNPGIIWALTLCLVIVVTHIEMRGVWSILALVLLVAATVVLAVLGLWDPILRWIGVIDIHINAFGYLSISLFLFVIWLLMFLVIDRLKYMVFTRGRLRVRKAIGEGEKVFDMRGMMFKRHRDDMFRHWLLGFGTADLTVFTSGANAQQIEMPNVLGVGRKLDLINTMLQELEVIKGR